MANYLEEQTNEIEALQSIYPEEFSLVAEDPYHSFELIIKTDDYEEGTENGATCTLQFTYVERYPDDIPEMSIEYCENVSEAVQERLIDYLTEQAKENLGMVMVFTLISSAQEWLCTTITHIKESEEQERERKIEEEETKERLKFEGHKVTVESFLVWKASFDAELEQLKKKKEKDEERNKKLTGRELFERDHSLYESDIQLMQDGEEEVTVDESLFQDIDDLDISGSEPESGEGEEELSD